MDLPALSCPLKLHEQHQNKNRSLPVWLNNLATFDFQHLRGMISQRTSR